MILFAPAASALQGWGHLMRCIAIADEVSAAGGATAFHVAGDTATAAMLLRGRHPWRAGDVGMIATAFGAATVLLDGYHYSDEDELRLTTQGLAVAAMDDDGHTSHRYARLIINGNPHSAAPDLYMTANSAQLLLGTRYTPLRSSLTALRRPSVRIRPVVESAVVVLGGSDSTGLSDTVLDAVTAHTTCRVVVAGAEPRDIPPRTWGRHVQRLRWVRDPESLALSMSQSDIAISAGGMTSYELAYLGIPSVLLPVTERQAPASSELQRRGAARVVTPPVLATLGNTLKHLCNAADEREAMALAGRAIFDGSGSRRIAQALIELSREAASIRGSSAACCDRKETHEQSTPLGRLE